MTKLTLELWLCLLAAGFIGCDGVCPAGHDPLANPVGDACQTSDECKVECVCTNADGDDIPVEVGSCLGGACEDADQQCAAGCGTHVYGGEFCRASP